MRKTRLAKTIKEELANSPGVNDHYGKLRLHFQEPNKPSQTRKSLNIPVTIENIKAAVVTLGNVKRDIINGIYENNIEKFWATHFPLDSSNYKSSISVIGCFEEYNIEKVNYLSDSKIDKLKSALNWLKHNNLGNKDLFALTTEKLDKIRQITVKGTKEELLQQREAAFVNKLEQDFGKPMLKTLDTKLIEKLRKQFERDNSIAFMGCSVATVNEYTKAVKQVLDYAVKKQYIKENPAFSLDRLAKDTIKLIKQDDNINPFSQSELDSLLHVIHVPRTKLIIQFLAWTGIRHGELKALAWEDVDLENKTIFIKYNLTRKGNLRSVKTEAGIREVELLPAALEVLIKLKELSYNLPAVNDVIHGNNQKFIELKRRRVFLSRGNEPYKRPEVSTTPNQWSNWLIKAGLSHRPAYQLRHTYASTMLMAGAKELWLASQMGHADTDMISKIYGKWIPKNEPDYINKLAEKLGQTY